MRLTLITFLFFVSLFNQNIYAQIIYVDKNATGNNNGNSWADAFTNLQTALDESQNGDEIWVTKGTYKPNNFSPLSTSTFIVESDRKLYGNFIGFESSINERVFDENRTILSGDMLGNDNSTSITKNDNSNHIVSFIEDVTSNCLFDGLQFENGFTSQGNGAAIKHIGSPTFRNCIFKNNQTLNGAGGALYLILGDTVEISNCYFENNKALSGGAIYSSENKINLSETTFENNSSSRGGAIFCAGSEMIVDHCSFCMNYSSMNSDEFWAGDGGAIYSSESDLTLEETIFNKNEGKKNGSAIFTVSISEPDHNFKATNCKFTNNTSQFRGIVHIINDNESSFIIKGTEFKNNICEDLGGIILSSTTGIIDSCQFIRNESGAGAAITNFNSAISILNSSFEFNFANIGGAILQGTLQKNNRISKSIFKTNHAINRGGAIFLISGDLNIDNSLFNNNISDNDRGGVIYIPLLNSHSEKDSIKISNCTIANNDSGIYYSGADTAFYQLDIQNSIFDNNKIDIAGSELQNINSLSGNLVSDPFMDFIFDTEFDILGLDPSFISPDDNDFRLSENSPGIDKGVENQNITLDLDCNPRDSNIDIGAYEFLRPNSTKHSELKESNISISPNPSSDIITLNFGLNNLSSFKIHNYLGQIIVHVKLKSKKRSHQINISDLPIGQYFITVKTEKGLLKKSFVKTN